MAFGSRALIKSAPFFESTISIYDCSSFSAFDSNSRPSDGNAISFVNNFSRNGTLLDIADKRAKNENGWEENTRN